jgi:hypothetical protein
LAESDRSDLDALKLFHHNTEASKHPPDLILAALDQLDLVPGIRAGLDGMNFRGRGEAAIEPDALAEPVHLIDVEPPAHLYLVGFGQVGCGRHDAVGELAVVREKQQAFAVEIEPADRVHAGTVAAQIGHDGRTALGVGLGGNDVFGLVERDVDRLRGSRAEKLTIDFDVVGFKVGLGAEGCDGFSVDRDAALGNQFFGLAAGGYANAGEDFLETLLHAGGRWTGGQ